MVEGIRPKGRISATVNAVTRQRREPVDPDERVSLPLDPEEALRALLRVDPDGPTVGQGDERAERRTRAREQVNGPTTGRAVVP